MKKKQIIFSITKGQSVLCSQTQKVTANNPDDTIVTMNPKGNHY